MSFLSPFTPPPAPADPTDVGTPSPSLPAESNQSSPVPPWKQALRERFNAWLESVEDSAETAGEMEGRSKELPDLHSFYAELAALAAEFRKSNRRTAEAFSQWSDLLDTVRNDVATLRKQAVTAADSAAPPLPRAHSLVLIEFMDRIDRIAAAFQSPPRLRWRRVPGAWRRAWETQEKALRIVQDHLAELLRQSAIQRIAALDQPFDPACMSAVETEQDPARPDQTVTAEIQPGYYLGEEILRFAQVRVNRRP